MAKGLGKGLSALFGEENTPKEAKDEKNIISSVIDIKLEDIEKNPYQPRKEFNKEKLLELSKSIKENGLLQPITVVKDGDKFVLISGERRLRASQLAGFKRIPAIVRAGDKEVSKSIFGILENIQREDLTILEESQSIRDLMDEFKLTQDQVSKILGKSRTYITNILRLLLLPEEVRGYINSGEISGSHGRSILALKEEDRVNGAREIVKKELTVRETEEFIRKYYDDKKIVDCKDRDPEIKKIENELEEKLGRKVKISGSKKGNLKISFYSQEDLEDLISRLRR